MGIGVNTPSQPPPEPEPRSAICLLTWSCFSERFKMKVSLLWCFNLMSNARFQTELHVRLFSANKLRSTQSKRVQDEKSMQQEANLKKVFYQSKHFNCHIFMLTAILQHIQRKEVQSDSLAGPPPPLHGALHSDRRPFLPGFSRALLQFGLQKTRHTISFQN